MIREVYMGDETREILRSEPTDYERASGAHANISTPQVAHDPLPSRRTTVSSSAANLLPLSPLGHRLEQQGARTGGSKFTASPTTGHLRPAEHSRSTLEAKRHRTSTRETDYEPAVATDARFANAYEEAEDRRKAGTREPPWPLAKRRRYESDYSKIPELDLEIDVGFDLLTDESPTNNLAENRVEQPSRKEVLEPPRSPNAQVEYGGEETIEALRAQISALKTLLTTKQEHIQALQAELNEREENHQADVQKIKQEMHREYSKQASEKLRVIIKRLELSAKKRAEQDWQDRVSKLNEAVENERNEKAELVQACDEYLRLKGF